MATSPTVMVDLADDQVRELVTGLVYDAILSTGIHPAFAVAAARAVVGVALAEVLALLAERGALHVVTPEVVIVDQRS